MNQSEPSAKRRRLCALDLTLSGAVLASHKIENKRGAETLVPSVTFCSRSPEEKIKKPRALAFMPLAREKQKQGKNEARVSLASLEIKKPYVPLVHIRFI